MNQPQTVSQKVDFITSAKNITRTEFYNQLQEKFPDASRSYIRDIATGYRKGERKGTLGYRIKQRINYIYRGVKRTKYVVVAIVFTKVTGYYGLVKEFTKKGGSIAFLENLYMSEEEEVVDAEIYTQHKHLPSQFTEDEIDEWVKTAESYGEDFINLASFIEQMRGVLVWK